jgi:arylsulfatase A-like enzyme
LNGIVGNSMFVPGVNGPDPFDTGDYMQLLALERVTGRVVTIETLGETLQRRGRSLVTLSSGSTGNGFLLNPSARTNAGAVIHGLFDRGRTAAFPRAVSDAVLARFGPPPPDSDDFGLMEWTERVLREYVLSDLRPDVFIDWLGPLDSAQHAEGVGSPRAKDALHRIDASIARTIDAIEALGILDRTDLFITSDHGFAHDAVGVDVTGALIDAGLKKDRRSTDLTVASEGESLLFYVPAHDRARIRRLVTFLQTQRWVSVIFTGGGQNGQGGVPGTFSLDLVKASHPTRAPDIEVSLSWGSESNAYGAPGSHTTDEATTGALPGQAGGHGGLNPWVTRNTLVVWGADVEQKGVRIEAPASSADIAPTVLALMGLHASSSDRRRGRPLREALKGGAQPAVTRRTLTASNGSYRATLNISSVAGYDYVDSGSAER